MFELMNVNKEDLTLDHLEVTRIESKQNVSKFDLSLVAYVSTDDIRLSFEYSNDLFEKDSIRRMSGHYCKVIDEIIENIDRQIGSITLLTEEEKKQVVIDWNNTEAQYPSDKCIHELFEEQVTKTPNAIAVLHNERQLTYRELNERANFVANSLIVSRKNFYNNNIVGIFSKRGINFLVAILGALKAGKAYLPLNPTHPENYTREIIKDCQVTEILTEENYVADINVIIKDLKQTINIHTISLNRSEFINCYSEIDVKSTDLAYIIFTSGTTGKPKYIMIEHSKKINHLFMMINRLSLLDKDIVAQTAPQCFDISVWQFLAPLLVGACTHIFDIELVQAPNKLLKAVINKSITILQIIPSLLDVILENTELMQNIKFEHLKWVIPTGESISLNLCKRWLSYFPHVPLINAYGPAECSDDVSLYVISKYSDLEGCISTPIGRPVSNTKMYILDLLLQPIPVGVFGEIYIGGDGLARGYLNRGALTAEKFIANPYSIEEDIRNNKDLRLYKTGDLGRYLSDGTIEFLGRLDDQVKIRGHRIELGEIENVLSNYEGIKQNVVLSKKRKVVGEDREAAKYLVGYYVSENNLDEEEILNYLLTKLPEYMVPNILVRLDKLPLTSNGKLDRKALPDPEFTNENRYVEPSNDIERKICHIWGEVLSLDESKVGIQDDFFGLGGNSILVIRLVSKLNRTLKTSIEISSVFKQKTISNLAKNLIHNKRKNHFK